MSEPKSLYELWANKSPEYEASIRKLQETLHEGDIRYTALFMKPHRDVSLFCAETGDIDSATLESKFGNAAVRQVIPRLLELGLLEQKGSALRSTKQALEIYKTRICLAL